jgi:hypothetical protein
VKLSSIPRRPGSTRWTVIASSITTDAYRPSFYCRLFLGSDQATEFTAAAGAEQAVFVARMQAEGQVYRARVSLYRGMFWLQFALLAAYVGPLWHSLHAYLDSCPFLPLFTGGISLSWRRAWSAHGASVRCRVTTAPRSGRRLRRCSAFKPLLLAASCIFCTSE